MRQTKSSGCNFGGNLGLYDLISSWACANLGPLGKDGKSSRPLAKKNFSIQTCWLTLELKEESREINLAGLIFLGVVPKSLVSATVLIAKLVKLRRTLSAFFTHTLS